MRTQPIDACRENFISEPIKRPDFTNELEKDFKMSKEAPTLQTFSESKHYEDGIPYPLFVPAEQLEKVKTYPIRPNDIFVASYPKSGTHWMLKIVSLVLNNGDDQYIEKSPQLFQDFQWFEAARMPGFPGDKVHDLPDPRVIVSHQRYSRMAGGPPNTTQAKYIYCSRNPKDVGISYYHYLVKNNDVTLKFDLSWEEFLEHFLRGDVMFGSWWDHVPEWWAHRHEPNILFLKYEDLKKDLPANVKAIADFLGRNLDQDTIQKVAQATTIDSMRANTTEWKEQHFIGKGVVGDWKNHFTPAQSEALDALYLKAVEGTGLEMEFD